MTLTCFVLQQNEVCYTKH